jgi:carbonic anhydrase
MTVIDELLERNAYLAATHEPLPSLPRLNLCIVTCPDPRVDPMAIFGPRPGDAAVVRAAAGRVSPIVMQRLAFLAATGSDYGQRPSTELILMTHTSCGIVNFMRDDRQDALAGFLGCSAAELSSRAVTDPREAVRRDIGETRWTNPRSGSFSAGRSATSSQRSGHDRQRQLHGRVQRRMQTRPRDAPARKRRHRELRRGRKTCGQDSAQVRNHLKWVTARHPASS